MSICFALDQVDLVFGRKPGRAFSAMDQGHMRDQIFQESGQMVAVHGMSFEVHAGEIFVLMGLSGSGKSSLLRCLNGMNGRGEGKMRGGLWFTDPLTGEKTCIRTCREKELHKIRRFQISMVFQQFGLMPWKTVWENVEYPLKLQGIKQSHRGSLIEEKLDLVGLSQWKDRYPHELSGGMQQRVGLARAFVTRGNVLLMDEPFSALDPLHRKHLQDEMLLLQKKLKKTIIFVTHDLAEATRLASRMAILEGGRMLQLGTPEEILSRPACGNVSRFVTAEVSSSLHRPLVPNEPVLENAEFHSLSIR